MKIIFSRHREQIIVCDKLCRNSIVVLVVIAPLTGKGSQSGKKLLKLHVLERRNYYFIVCDRALAQHIMVETGWILFGKAVFHGGVRLRWHCSAVWH